MARRRAPQNKAQPKAPENKEPFTEENESEDIPAEEIEEGDPDEQDDQENEQDELTEFVDRDFQLRRLLKAENNQWAGTVSRQDLHKIADRIRAELRGETEVEEEGADG